MHHRIVSFTAIMFILLWGSSLFAQDIAMLEDAFERDLKKAKQYPKNESRIDALAASYAAIALADQERIQQLRATGQPDIWYSVYKIMENMDWRQKQVMLLPEPARERMNFTYEDMADEILETRNKASAYFYAHARKLLEQKKPDAARMAYLDLVRLAGLTGEFKDMDALIRTAVLYGATDIQYELYNRTGWKLQSAIVEQLSVAVYAYRHERLEKAAADASAAPFPFIIKITLTELKVSPDRVKKANYVEERDIYRDGVVVDTIRCSIDQYRQVKGAVLSGKIEIFDVGMNSVINTVPVTAESMFIHTYATLKGNPDAAGEDTRMMLKQKEVKFPSNEAMVMDAVEEFTRQAIGILLPPGP